MSDTVAVEAAPILPVVAVVGPASSLLLEQPDSTRAPVAANTAAMRQKLFGPL